jgi:hypothetical protein
MLEPAPGVGYAVSTHMLNSAASYLQGEATGVASSRDAFNGACFEAASRWQTVMSGRVADANLSSEVLAKAGSLLQHLADDLDQEQNYYSQASAELQDKAGSYNLRFNLPPPDFEAPFIAAMSRATNLLQQAGTDFLALAALADDIHAKGAVNRIPGVPESTNRKAASLALLTFLLGMVSTNQAAGSAGVAVRPRHGQADVGRHPGRRQGGPECR